MRAGSWLGAGCRLAGDSGAAGWDGLWLPSTQWLGPLFAHVTSARQASPGLRTVVLVRRAPTAGLPPHSPPQAFDLAENFNAPELSKRCTLYCLERYKEMLEGGGVKSPAAYAVLMQKMQGRLKEAVEEQIRAKAAGAPEVAVPQR